jgi:ATP-dependent 26S proteasome regulatory subunit
MQLFLNNRNSIFIIEDGEKLLINRETENNSPISALLNMSDGLIGQLLNSQIICTFNTSLDKIDEALLRNGRLISMYEFTALDKDRAIELAKLIKKPHSHIKTATTLADIYNQIEPSKAEFKSNRKPIGFHKD